MPPPNGFEYRTRADGSVVITHHGRPATVLRGGRAAEFLAELGTGMDQEVIQEVMARWTGNYRRGNERQARQHPRNRGRP
jgi:hypothetical protein